MITNSFLNELAEYVSDRVSKVVINGTYEITDFDVKEVEGSLFTLTYLIPFEHIKTVELIEVKKSNGDIISTNNVFVPLTTDHIMTQTIDVKERS